MEKRMLHAKHPSVCLDPGIGVVQVASVLNYNKRKMFARKVDDDIVYSPSFVKLPRLTLNNLRQYEIHDFFLLLTGFQRNFFSTAKDTLGV
jgi:hypothetical protein